MPHVTHIEIENFRSFRKASCRLSPFTLVVGANNSGKSNLLRAIAEAPFASFGTTEVMKRHKHHAADGEQSILIELIYSDGEKVRASDGLGTQRFSAAKNSHERFPIYQLDPATIGECTTAGENAIGTDGSGVPRVLERLRSGTRAGREIADKIERDVSRFVPEIEAISVDAPEPKKRCVQIEQRGIERDGQPFPVPLAEASEGTRLIVAIATLINLKPLPELILLEDLDRAIHPRLFEKIVDFLRNLTRDGRVQIIATCHNPYLVDQFREEPGAVVIVDKRDGASVLSNMDDRIKPLLDEDGEVGRPLGEIWFEGLVGGVPEVRVPPLSPPLPEPELSARVAEAP